MHQDNLKSSGLRGMTAGKTALSTVGKDGVGLTYRGYSIEDLSMYAGFEETVWLLFYGKLPSQQELTTYKEKLKKLRDIPEPVKFCLEKIPATTHPMDVMRSACSLLGDIEPEGSFEHQYNSAERILASLPSMLLYWYQFSHHGIRIDPLTDEETLAGHFLHLLHNKTPTADHRRCLDVSLILYAEHEFNASTFTARVCAATLSDIHSCVTGAIGTLKGPLHGGANEAAMEMIERYQTPAEAKNGLLAMLEKKEKIMGFGHAIYRDKDPRNNIIKEWSAKLAQSCGDKRYYPVSEIIEKTMWEEKKLCANADFYHASAYHFMNIPTKLFTPLFVCARSSGWMSHVMEQRADNRLIRPSAEYIGPELQKWQPIESR
ncbi:MAG: 2-methylcitrate synthase [Endozoicomonadaceae bacterium]|nr:2-methylcitrate synthase [Endozoicomonadaceae bacterium]